MQSVKRRPVWALMAILLAAAAVFSGCAKRSVDASVPSPEPSYAQSEIENALSGSVQEALALFEKQQEGADGAAQNFPKTSVSAAAPEAEQSPEPTPTPTIPQVSSQMPYMIVIYIGSQRVVVYQKDADGAYTVPARVFTVSTGLGSNTILGQYKIQSRWRWLPMHGIYCQYVTQWSGNYLFHSVMYSQTDPSTMDRSAYNRLGSKASAGCIRMTVRDAKWIYDNCGRGTYVIATNDSCPPGTPGSSGVPPLTLDVRWDPTDPDPRNPYITGLPTPTPTPEPTPAPEPTPVPSPSEEPTPVPSETPSPTPTPVPSEAPTPTPVPTPTPAPPEPSPGAEN